MSHLMLLAHGNLRGVGAQWTRPDQSAGGQDQCRYHDGNRTLVLHQALLDTKPCPQPSVQGGGIVRG